MNRNKLLQKLQALDQDLQALFDQLQTYSHEALNTAPQTGAWTATQVLHHVRLAEFYSQKYCEKKLSFNPPLKRAAWPERLRSKVVAGYLRLPLKVTAPKNLSGPALPTESQLSALIEQWTKQRKSLAKFLSTLPDHHLDKAVYKHPMGGRLSFAGMLDFFEAHFRRHEQQIWRTISK
jgi:hypothetical protein